MQSEFKIGIKDCVVIKTQFKVDFFKVDFCIYSDTHVAQGWVLFNTLTDCCAK